MQFIIQHNLMAEQQLLRIKDALKDIPHQYVGVIPFSHEITSDEPLSGTAYIPYGSTLMTTLAFDLKWRGLHFDLDKFNYEESLRNRDDMLNAEHVLSLNDAVHLLKTSSDRDWFIRPSQDLKQFAGQVMSGHACAEWLIDATLCESSGTYKLEPDTVVVLATPKLIQAEWRWFVVGGKVVDGSMYRIQGVLYKKHETDNTVIQEAQTFADRWLPNECCVMDLALVDDEVKVVEFNCINSSGFYDHDVSKIMKTWYNYYK